MKHHVEFIKKYWPAYIPLILLNIIAINQIYLSNVDYLNPWKGGGFGMFSEIHLRYYHIHLMNQGAFECADTPNDFSKDLKKIKNYPKYLSLEQLTKKLTKKTWVYNEKNNNPLDTPTSKLTSVYMIGRKNTLKAHNKIAKFNAIELQVFDVSFNRTNFTLEPKLLRKIRYLK